MTDDLRAAPGAAGFRVGDAEDFLGPDAAERAEVRRRAERPRPPRRANPFARDDSDLLIRLGLPPRLPEPWRPVAPAPGPETPPT